ncbi:hypothetical protein KIPB_015837, partial [Kipferlia bialata]
DHKIVYEDEGDCSTEYLPGSVVISVTVLDHPVFTREGDDLHTDLTLTLSEALTGCTRTITHLDSHEVVVRRKSVTQPGDIVLKKGEGMPKTNGEYGDLYVHLK